MSYTTIEEYNNYLVENESKVDIIEYITEINELEYNIDISFINEFIKLVGRKDFCIRHLMLQKYGVSNLISGSNDIKKILVQNKFIEMKDFRLRNISESTSGGCTHKIEYYLTPKAFKLCLIRSKNTTKYANYYLLLEDSITYFKEYQDKLKDKLKDIKISKLKKNIFQKNNIIDKLQEQIDLTKKNYENQIKYQQEDRIEQRKKHKEQMKKSDEILKNNINITEKLDNITEELVETKDELVETKEILEDTNNNVRLIAKKLDIAVEDRVCRTIQASTDEYLTILKSNTNINNYYIIRSQKRSINERVKTLKEYHKIKSIKCVPNAINLFNLIKQNMKDNIYCKSNKINLININENDFLETIDNIYDERKIVEIND